MPTIQNTELLLIVSRQDQTGKHSQQQYHPLGLLQLASMMETMGREPKTKRMEAFIRITEWRRT